MFVEFCSGEYALKVPGLSLALQKGFPSRFDFMVSLSSRMCSLCLIGFTGPDSLVVRASASGSEGRGFAPRPRHTKGVKNGTGSSLADARNKRVVPGRYKSAGRYLLLVMSQ